MGNDNAISTNDLKTIIIVYTQMVILWVICNPFKENRSIFLDVIAKLVPKL